MNKTFYKYEGTGNDFILFEDYHLDFPTTPDLIQLLCNRKKGVGADGVLLLQPSSIADVKMRIFNQDGSEASMCGNGLRCVIKHLQKSSQIETLGGISTGEYLSPMIKVMIPKAKMITSTIKITDQIIGHLVDTGTPHLVIFTTDFKEIEIAKKLRKDKRFGENGVNVNLAKVEPAWKLDANKLISEVSLLVEESSPLDRGALQETKVFLRTFEKGVDEETESCGSGGAAVTFLLNCATSIFFPRHTLYYTIDKNKQIWMQGETTQTFQGSLCIKRG